LKIFQLGSEPQGQASVVDNVNNAIQRINHYLADSAICYVNTYPLDSDVSGGYRYPAYEQPILPVKELQQ